MKIVSFNVNGIRARLHQLEALVASHQPDIIGLQETKVQDSEFPMEAIREMGYHASILGQKGHYGVAFLTKEAPISVQYGTGDEHLDSQKRLIGLQYPYGNEVIHVLNGYFPQGESRDHEVKFPFKASFYQRLSQAIMPTYSQQSHVIVMGDVNVACEDLDIGIGEANQKRWLQTGKCSFLPEERDWLAHLMQWGLSDAYRLKYPDESLYSWFDYRSRGFNDNPKRGLRIDLQLISDSLVSKLCETGIDYDIRAMEKPSDHAPVWLTLSV